MDIRLWYHGINVKAIYFKMTFTRVKKDFTKKKRKSNISKPLKFRVHESNNWTCYYCGKRLVKLPEYYRRTRILSETGEDGQIESVLCYDAFDSEYPRSELACVDHKLPLNQGGTNRKENLVTACWECNSQKSDLYTEEEFLAIKATTKITNAAIAQNNLF